MGGSNHSQPVRPRLLFSTFEPRSIMKRLFVVAVSLAFLIGCDSQHRRVPVTGAPVPVVAPTGTVYSAPAAPPVPAVTTPVAAPSTESIQPSVSGPGAVPALDNARTLPIVRTPELPAPVDEVIRLAQSGIGEDVMLGYISGIRQPYSLSADQLIYLKDVGISMPVLEALVKQGSANTPAPLAVPGTPSAAIPVPNAPPGPPAAIAETSPSVVYGQPQPGGNAAQAPAPMVVTQPAPPQVVGNSYFYESLSPYGSWVDVAPYGWCWRPTVSVVDVGWQPYLHGGNWLWSDAGWYWNSEYSWGWAPFHYGRWHRGPSFGWVWVPGTTWGPSWVTWRTGGGNCGWAPLPPEAYWTAGVGFTYYGSHVSVGFGWGLDPYSYCFVPYSRYCDRNVSRHRHSREQNQSIVKDSTIINPVINGNNNTVIINNGLDHREVQKHTGEEIRKTSLRDAGSPAEITRGATGGQRPAAIAVYRPNLPAQTAELPTHIVQRQEVRKNAPLPNLTPAASLRPGQSSGIKPNPGAPAGSVSAPSRRSESSTRSPAPPLAPAPSRSSEVARPTSRPSSGAAPVGGNPPPSVQRPASNFNQSPPASRPAAAPQPPVPSTGRRPSNPSPSASPSATGSGIPSQPRPVSEIPRTQTRPQPTLNSPSEAARGEVRKFESAPRAQSYPQPAPVPSAGTQFQGRPVAPSAPTQRFEQRSIPSPTYRTESAPAPQRYSPSPTYQSPPARGLSPAPTYQSSPRPPGASPAPPVPQGRPAPPRNETAPSRPTSNQKGSNNGNGERQ